MSKITARLYNIKTNSVPSENFEKNDEISDFSGNV
jgi:hypothetical protein